MSYRLLFILTLFLTIFQAQAATPENRFYDKSTEHFSATVGRLASRAGYIHFADAEVPTDPNTPVDRALPGDFDIDAYSYTIEGDDAAMFSAMITSVSASENGCTVRICYAPTEAGTHQATLKVFCETAGAPMTTIYLSGQAFPRIGDVDGDGKLGIADVSSLIDMLLNGQ